MLMPDSLIDCPGGMYLWGEFFPLNTFGVRKNVLQLNDYTTFRMLTSRSSVVVPPSAEDSPEDILLRGVVRVEKLENPEQYIRAVLQRTKPQHIERTYEVKGFENHLEFLELLARKGGRLLKGGEADVDGVAKQVLNDFLRGKLPWFTPLPALESQDGEKIEGINGRKGALGEMGRIKQREDKVDKVEKQEANLEEHAPSDQQTRPAKRRKKG